MAPDLCGVSIVGLFVSFSDTLSNYRKIYVNTLRKDDLVFLLGSFPPWWSLYAVFKAVLSLIHKYGSSHFSLIFLCSNFRLKCTKPGTYDPSSVLINGRFPIYTQIRILSNTSLVSCICGFQADDLILTLLNIWFKDRSVALHMTDRSDH